MSEELDVLQEVTQRLAGAHISYMVTGSMAANFYAVRNYSGSGGGSWHEGTA